MESGPGGSVPTLIPARAAEEAAFSSLPHFRQPVHEYTEYPESAAQGYTLFGALGHASPRP